MKNVTPSQAYQMLLDEPSAQLIDVRTEAEWAFVGLPDLSDAGKQVLLISWQTYPAMQVNDKFLAQMEAMGVAKGAPLLFICRSGVRSAQAALAAEAAGYGPCDNVADGFEGPVDAAGHRGGPAGWKAESLPWRQR